MFSSKRYRAKAAEYMELGKKTEVPKEVGEFKALIFGALAALVASYKGLNAGGGPKGVGDAVNQSVVITFMLLFFTNFILTAMYFQIVPQKSI